MLIGCEQVVATGCCPLVAAAVTTMHSMEFPALSSCSSVVRSPRTAARSPLPSSLYVSQLGLRWPFIQFSGQFDTASILCTQLWEVCVYYSGSCCTPSLLLSLSSSHTVGIPPTQSRLHGGVLAYPSRGGRLAAAMWRHYSLAQLV